MRVSNNDRGNIYNRTLLVEREVVDLPWTVWTLPCDVSKRFVLSSRPGASQPQLTDFMSRNSR
jgi:hypothetical protein